MNRSRLSIALAVLLISSLGNAAETYFPGRTDFGIPFSKVDDAVAKAFWEAYTKSDSLTRGVTQRDLVSSSPSSALKATHKAVPVIKKAVMEYAKTAHLWLKTKCVSVDMNLLARERKLKFTQGIRAIPKEYFFMEGPTNEELEKSYGTLAKFWKDKERNPDEWATIHKCSFEHIHGRDAKEGETNQVINPDALANDDWQLVADPRRVFVTAELGAPLLNAYVGLSAHNTKTKETWYGTKFSAFSEESQTEDSIDPANSPVAIGFHVVDNYLIPSRTHSLSKGFAVPVAKFDPATGKILAYYDYGLLVLYSLPVGKYVALTTVVSKDKAQKVLANKDVSLLGSHAGKGHGVNQYVALGDYPVTTPYWNYDRIPTGSIHFMANAFWTDAAAASSDNAVILRVHRYRLIDLYMANNAWVNTYDNVVTASDKADSQNTIETLVKGGCAQPHPTNIPNGMWLSHEIIVGGEAGRQHLIEQARPTVVVDGCGKSW